MSVSQAAKELHQVGIITPFQLGIGGSYSRIASGQGFGLHREVGISVDIGGVHRDVTKPCADRIDVNTSAKQMGRGCVSNGMGADLLVLQRRNLVGRGLDVPLHKGVDAKAGHAIAIIEVMDILGQKLGPLLLQFGYFNKKAFLGVNDFLARLRPFLKRLPKDHKFAVEIRNKNWLVPQFVETLRERGVALALIDQSWTPRPSQWFEKFDPITADFTYVRWLGDRKRQNGPWIQSARDDGYSLPQLS